ncbi:hypothetical protein U3A58_10420 [Algoriphagus sp. C2-6-M1]|uniref:hypothetical protein n=1 Tax=Algoriphagus persicinus TaxID=3108754 RepID=UPI002B39377A|nr:hypothetical protein [Algoriphagus sp. C2-6-M1]MEB2780808.1 hypothetical protein [Algoriphagus sp. C2-6-M1]
MTLKEKVELFIKDLENNIDENIPKVHSQFLNDYGWPEFDPLREEISRCLICDLCQAAITLTNHLLENFLKTMLIYNDNSGLGTTQDMRTAFKIGIEKYNDKGLVETIARAKRFGIITKEDGKILNQYREDFRNAYSHADKKKIFKDLKVPTQVLSLNKDLKYELGEPGDFDLSELPFVQGIAQSMLSKKSAFEYFIKVDGIIRYSLDTFGSKNRPKNNNV